MPELPEVETIVRQLDSALSGAIIKRVEVCDKRIDLYPEALANKRILRVRRRGKFIVFELESVSRLICHLGMSGRLLMGSKPQEGQHLRVVLFTDRGPVFFWDPRRFGKMEMARSDSLASLGVEPLGGELTRQVLGEMLQKSRASLKGFLLDQRRIAGIGNIYACEILYESGLSPLRGANTLDEGEVQGLWEAIRKVLQQALEWGGTTLQAYTDAWGAEGGFQDRLKVYGREGATCPRCGQVIQRFKQGGRSTYYCPGCQR